MRFNVLALVAIAVCAACASVSESSNRSQPVVAQSPAPFASPLPPLDPSIEARTSSVETMDGTILLVSVKVPRKWAGKEVRGNFEGIDLPFFKDTDPAALPADRAVHDEDGSEIYRAVLGVPYDRAAGPAAVRVRVGDGRDEGARGALAEFKVVAGDYASETLKVDGRRVKPQNPKDLARIGREQKEIGAVYSAVTATKYWKGPFELPVRKIQAVTSSFGAKRIYNGIQNSAHLGLDFKAPTGTPIYASGAGRVALSKNLFFTGNTVIVDHGYGVLTLYAHLDRLKVKRGQVVAAGDLLGLSGKTGRVTGPHLHWMAIIHKQKVNPLGLTQVMR